MTMMTIVRVPGTPIEKWIAEPVMMGGFENWFCVAGGRFAGPDRFDAAVFFYALNREDADLLCHLVSPQISLVES